MPHIGALAFYTLLIGSGTSDEFASHDTVSLLIIRVNTIPPRGWSTQLNTVELLQSKYKNYALYMCMKQIHFGISAEHCSMVLGIHLYMQVKIIKF